MRRALISLGWLAAFASGAWAGDLADCKQEADRPTRIRGCTAILKTKRTESHAMAFENRGRAHFDHANYQWAIADFESVLKLQPTRADMYVLRGQALAKIGRLDAARSSFNSAIALDSKSAASYVGLANAKARQGLTQDAIADLETALKLAPDNLEVRQDLDTLKSPPPKVPQEEKKLAAVSDLTEVIKTQPNAANYYARGKNFEDLGRTREAMDDYVTALQIDDKYVGALTALAGIRWRERDWPAALAHFERVLAIRNDFGVLWNVQSIRVHLEDFDTAIREAVKNVENNPGDAPSLNTRAFAYMAAAKYREAVEDLNKVIELDPKQHAYFNNRCHALVELDQPAAAVKDCEQAILLNNGYANSYKHLSTALVALKKPMAAMDAINKALALDTQYVAAYVARARLFDAQGHRREAINDCVKALLLPERIGRFDDARARKWAKQALEDWTVRVISPEAKQ
jgi:tetratricopeptide (TPR) repeat protein